MKVINYFTEAQIKQAFEEATKNQLPVLVDFWSEGCKGCKKMDIITYEDSEIIQYIYNHFVFVKYNTAYKLHSFRNTYITSPHLWTPCFIVFANDGSEVRKISGFLPPKQFFNEMELGRAMSSLRKAKSFEALEALDSLINSAKDDLIIQEALYWAGVSAFYANKREVSFLSPYWEKLMNLYPKTNWAERADCLDIVL